MPRLVSVLGLNKIILSKKTWITNKKLKWLDDVTIINSYIIILNNIKSWYYYNTNKIYVLFYYITKKTKMYGYTQVIIYQLSR